MYLETMSYENCLQCEDLERQETAVLNSNDFVPARSYVQLTTGDVVKILREWMNWSRNDLAKHSGININNICLIENNKIDIGKQRAIALGKALRVHPAMIMFPDFCATYINRSIKTKNKGRQARLRAVSSGPGHNSHGYAER